MLLSAIVLGSVLVAAAETGPIPDDRSAYEAAKAKVGRDAGAHVRLAVWCEQHGLTAERTKHLAVALLIDPQNAMARGLMGFVSFQGRWQRPDRLKADEKLAADRAAYNGLRERMGKSADAHWKMALWCEQHGLQPEAVAHFSVVTRLDPSREAAWKRLGCKKHDGRWMSDADIAAEKAESEAQKKADKHWAPLLKKWRGWLAENTRREEAEKAIAEITDPRAVPAIWTTFVSGGPAHHRLAVRTLGQIDAAASSQALASLAVFDASPEVRRAAAEILKRRDLREYAGRLVAMIRTPVKYQVRPVAGPGSAGVLFVEGERFNSQRLYAPPAFTLRLMGTQAAMIDGYGMPAAYNMDETASMHGSMVGISPHIPGRGPSVRTLQTPPPPQSPEEVAALVQKTELYRLTGESQFAGMANEIQKTAIAAEQQLENDVRSIESYNRNAQALNAAVIPLLSSVADKNYGDDAKAWHGWYLNQLGYAITSDPVSKPTVVENVALDYQPASIGPFEYFPGIGYMAQSCFGAGTLVQTLDGRRPIEALKIGDLVLSQDVKTGSLSFQPIIVVHHNPPSPTFLIKVRGETIVSSPFHRFWVVGKGWIMARDLAGGERLRLLDGPAKVESVESGPVQPVFNLDIAGTHDFFAGACAALVHDNSLPELRFAPFDAPALATAATPDAPAAP